jgi:hypothetical protein
MTAITQGEHKNEKKIHFHPFLGGLKFMPLEIWEKPNFKKST